MFAGEVERGKESVHLGKVLKLLPDEAAIALTAEYADSAKESVEEQFSKSAKPLKPRTNKVNQ